MLYDQVSCCRRRRTIAQGGRSSARLGRKHSDAALHAGLGWELKPKPDVILCTDSQRGVSRQANAVDRAPLPVAAWFLGYFGGICGGFPTRPRSRTNPSRSAAIL